MNHWLFKTEPDEFSIDDLHRLGRERWDGIRNYQARNLLRDQVQVGDGVLIYHSSCKQVGVVGVAEVVKAAYADPAQFDANSPYFDAKSKAEQPRWVCVDVAFKYKFNKPVLLSTIKKDPCLVNMVLVKQGRLSVQPVSEDEWHHITDLGQ